MMPIKPLTTSALCLQWIQKFGGTASLSQLAAELHQVKPDLKRPYQTVASVIRQSRFVKASYGVYRSKTAAEICADFLAKRGSSAYLHRLANKVHKVRPDLKDSYQAVKEAMGTSNFVQVGPKRFAIQDSNNSIQPFKSVPKICADSITENGGNASFTQLVHKVREIRSDINDPRQAVKRAMLKPQFVRIRQGEYTLLDPQKPIQPFKTVAEICRDAITKNGGNASLSQLVQKVREVRLDLKNPRRTVKDILYQSSFVRISRGYYTLADTQKPPQSDPPEIPGQKCNGWRLKFWPLLEGIRDRRASTPVSSVINSEQKKRVRNALRRLDPLAQKVIKLQFGFMAWEKVSREEVRKLLELPPLEVAEIEAKAFKLLQRSLASEIETLD